MEANSVFEDAKRVNELLTVAGATDLPCDRPDHADSGQRSLAVQRAEELIREIRAGRDSR